MTRQHTTEYKYQDNKGSYLVRFGDRTLEVKFVGYLDSQLINKFCADLDLMLGIIEWPRWGYYGDLSECDGQSTETRDVLTKLHKRFMQTGCVVDAYSTDKQDVINNIIQSRQAAGLTQTNLDGQLFPDKQQAIQFIQDTLEKIESIELD